MKLPEYDLFLNTLSNRKRLKIINLLRKEPKTVTEIYKLLKLEQSTVSRHLGCLQRCGFVFAKRKGKSKVYSLNEKTILPLMKLIDMHTKKFCKKLCECKENKR